MSGGRFNFQNDYLANDIFWESPNYGKKGFDKYASARRRNPFEDKQISELIWDVFCLIHSYDWYYSGDINEDAYLKDIDYFKQKWLSMPEKELIKREIDLSLEEMRVDLYRTLGVVDDGEADKA